MLVDAGAALTVEAVLDLLPDLLTRLGFGALAGLGGGWALAWLIDRIELHSGLEPPFALAGAVALFAATQAAGGSGFLAIYLCGVTLAGLPAPAGGAHRPLPRRARLARPDRDAGDARPPGHARGARRHPAARARDGGGPDLRRAARSRCWSACCRSAFRAREQLYIGWVGLRGAVPIFLAIIPVISPGPISVGFFNIVFVIVVVSLVLQGWTLAAAARWLGVAAESQR